MDEDSHGIGLDRECDKRANGDRNDGSPGLKSAGESADTRLRFGLAVAAPSPAMDSAKAPRLEAPIAHLLGVDAVGYGGWHSSNECRGARANPTARTMIVAHRCADAAAGCAPQGADHLARDARNDSPPAVRRALRRRTRKGAGATYRVGSAGFGAMRRRCAGLGTPSSLRPLLPQCLARSHG